MCCVTASCSTTFNFLLHAVNGSELRKVLFFALSVYGFFLFVYEIHREPLNGFAPYSHGRRVWSLVWTSLKVKGQGHQGQKRHFLALSAACLWSMFGKTSLASSILLVYFMSFVSWVVWQCLLCLHKNCWSLVDLSESSAVPDKAEKWLLKQLWVHVFWSLFTLVHVAQWAFGIIGAKFLQALNLGTTTISI